jgi:APA family basic amino acid/polyamine antiporter
LFAFMMVAISVMVLRRKDPARKRPFRVPAVGIIAPLAIIGCVGLYLSLPLLAILVLPVWGGIGLIVYFLYSRNRSHVGLGLDEVHENDGAIPPMPGAAPPTI